VLTCTAALKVQEVRKTGDAGYAYIAIYQLDDFDEIISARDFVQSAGTAGWAEHQHTFAVDAGCRTVSVRCGLFQATGTGWFDDFTLVAGEKGQTAAQAAAEEAAVAQRLGLGSGRLGAVAILNDDLPASGAAAAPDHLARVLRRADFDVAFLDSDQLADPQFLNRSLFDGVLLPYGPSFPVKAAANFRRFLQHGGKFVSTGGYAFDNLLERTPGGWKPPALQPSANTDHVIWHCEIPAAELRDRGRLTFSDWLKAAHIAGPGMAFFAVSPACSAGTTSPSATANWNGMPGPAGPSRGGTPACRASFTTSTATCAVR
jgi:hypothetical protein